MLEFVHLYFGISKVSDDVQREYWILIENSLTLKNVLIILHTLIQKTQILFGMDDES